MSPTTTLKWKDLIAIFVVGAFGGTSPFLLRMAMDLTNNKTRIDSINESTIVGVALLAILGGGVATVWKEPDFKKAFYIGLGLPSLLTVATSNAQLGNAPPVHAGMFIVAVHAAENDAGSGPAKGRTISAIVPTEGGKDIAFVFSLSGNSLQTAHTQSGITVDVPENAVAVTVSAEHADPASTVGLPARPYADVSLRFRTESEPWYGLWYALGRRVKPLRLILSASPIVTLGCTPITGIWFVAEVNGKPATAATKFQIGQEAKTNRCSFTGHALNDAPGNIHIIQRLTMSGSSGTGHVLRVVGGCTDEVTWDVKVNDDGAMGVRAKSTGCSGIDQQLILRRL